MDSEHARELFSEAFEGDLDEAKQRAFEEALEADDALREEYDEFLETFALMGQLREEVVPTPNLLPKIQERIRRRSRGRFYRDRFSQRIGMQWMLPVIASIAVIFLLAVTWYALETAVLLDGEEAASTEEGDPTPNAPEPELDEPESDEPGSDESGSDESGSDEPGPDESGPRDTGSGETGSVAPALDPEASDEGEAGGAGPAD